MTDYAETYAQIRYNETAHTLEMRWLSPGVDGHWFPFAEAHAPETASHAMQVVDAELRREYGRKGWTSKKSTVASDVENDGETESIIHSWQVRRPIADEIIAANEDLDWCVRQLAQARERATDVIRRANAIGWSEVDLAREIGVDRMTIRRALGKM